MPKTLILILSLLLLACGTDRLADGLPDSDSLDGHYHPASWGESHGQAYFATRSASPLTRPADACENCHGDTLQTVINGQSCSSCHTDAQGHALGDAWMVSCTFCHGGQDNATGAPPRALDGSASATTLPTGAHSAHVGAGLTHAAFDCSACHLKPKDIFSLGHPDGVVEVRLATLGGQVALYAAQEGTCQNTYCHGAGRTSPAWNDPTPLSCHSCHGDADVGTSTLSGAHAAHIQSGIGCQSCHAEVAAHNADGSFSILDPTKHVNGTKDVALSIGSYDAATQTCTATCHSTRTW